MSHSGSAQAAASMSTLKPARRVAVIGAGPSGAIAVDALVRENVFDVIRVFERREGPGGCWLGDTAPPPPLTNLLPALAARRADPPLAPIPAAFPARTPARAHPQPRFAESSIYPYLETNVEDLAMCFTGGGRGGKGEEGGGNEGDAPQQHAAAEAIPAERSAWSVAVHGEDTPFRHWTVMRRYVEGLFARGGYGERLVCYGTSVERAEKRGGEWVLTLRREEEEEEEGEVGGGKKKSVTDVWTQERFDAVVVASGHFNVPWIPPVEGLDEFERRWPGSVLHSKMFRGRDDYRDKRVVVVGASVSAADIAYDLATHRATRDGGVVHAIVEGHTFNGYFGDEAFRHPLVRRHPSIARVDAATRTVHLVSPGAGAGATTSIPDVDRIIFGTGYSWSLPFLADAGDAGRVAVRNNRVPGLYQHVVWRGDPTLLFVGAVGAGLTFKIFEWQAVYAARLLAGRGRLPSAGDMARWEEDRVAIKGDGPAFQMVYPDFEEYFETLRALAGEPARTGTGRRLPRFDEAWVRAFMGGHERRKAMWRRLNQEAREQVEREKEKGVAAKM